MPNDCWNSITVTGSKEDIDNFAKNEFTDVPEWALIIKERGRRGIIFDMWSRWTVNKEWLEGLIIKYPSIWIKNFWSVLEDAAAGIWIGSKAGIKTLEWDEPCIKDGDKIFRSFDIF